MKVQPISYGVRDSELQGRLTMDYTGKGKWAIRFAHQCLSKKGNWIYEPMPSSRTESFFKKTRFGFKEAMKVFKKEIASFKEVK